MEDKIKELKAENETLQWCLEGVSAFEKEMHDNALRVAKEIVRRDSKAIANIILNMSFGNRNNVSFCEIFGLREAAGCEKHRLCTNCIHEYLEKHSTSQYVHAENMIRKLHEAGGCDATDEYSEGWDAAITEAIRIVEDESGIKVGDVL